MNLFPLKGSSVRPLPANKTGAEFYVSLYVPLCVGSPAIKMMRVIGSRKHQHGDELHQYEVQRGSVSQRLNCVGFG